MDTRTETDRINLADGDLESIRRAEAFGLMPQPGDLVHVAVVGNHVHDDATYVGMYQEEGAVAGVTVVIGGREIHLAWGDMLELWMTPDAWFCQRFQKDILYDAHDIHLRLNRSAAAKELVKRSTSALPAILRHLQQPYDGSPDLADDLYAAWAWLLGEISGIRPDPTAEAVLGLTDKLVNWRHPELRKGEVLLGNFEHSALANIAYAAFRIGEVAYRVDGTLLSEATQAELVPIFVLKSDIEAQPHGARIKAQLQRSRRW